jgi:hypothetical protein
METDVPDGGIPVSPDSECRGQVADLEQSFIVHDA